MTKSLSVIQKRIVPFVLLAAVLLSALPLKVIAVVPGVSFRNVEYYPTPSGPLSIAVGDFDKNGVPDLVVASSSYYISVLLGNGDGTFQERKDYYAKDKPLCVVVGDFNKDGNPDLAVKNRSRLLIYPGKSDGTFEEAFDCGAEINYSQYDSYYDYIAANDFNNDGNTDLVVVNAQSEVTILLGNGDGTFEKKAEYSAGTAGAVNWHSIATGDFNGDNNIDFIVTSYYNDDDDDDDIVFVFLGKGDGTFEKSDYKSSQVAYGIAVGDFDDYGNTDMALAGWDLIVYSGNGDGTFQESVKYIVNGCRAYTLVPGDFNGDGITDLVITSYFYVLHIFVFLGAGDGTFQDAGYYYAGSEPRCAVGDFNGDGKPDIATANYNNGNVGVLLNNTPLLDSLSISTGTLDPAFRPGILSYTVDVANTVTSLDLTAITMAGSSDQLSINGQPQMSGMVRTISPLKAGPNPITIDVTNPDGITCTYTVTVRRAFADPLNADLFRLQTSTGLMSPSFSPDVTNYRVEADSYTSSVDITALPSDPHATMTINGRSVGGGEQTVTVNPAPGDNPVTIEVMAGNGIITKTYTVNIVRGLGNDRLQHLGVGNGTLDPAFDPMTVAYAVYGQDSLQQLDITAVAQVPSAMLSVNYAPPAAGSITETVRLKQGANLIPVVVTAPDGVTEQCYVLSVNGTVSDANLGSLSAAPGSLAFDPAVTSYTMSVDSMVSGLTISAAPHDPNALVLVNGSMLSGGSAAISLSPGVNTIEVMVVAQDASTKTYTITVTRGYPPVIWNAGSLTASAITARGLTLTWPAAVSDAGIAGYEIYQGTNLIATLPGTTTSYNVAGLNAGTTYTFTVIAKDGGGNSSPALTATAATIYDTSPSIDTPILGVATVGTAYYAPLAASGGNAPYTWSASGLPAGLSIDASTGVISGIPAAAGINVVNITLTDRFGAATTRGYTLSVMYPSGTGRYIVTPVADAAVYTVENTPDGITALTVKNGVSGFKYFTVDISLTESHAGDETAVFVQLRNGTQIALCAISADFDTVSRAKAGFNVQAGDVIKVYLVDDLNNSKGFNPTLLQ